MANLNDLPIGEQDIIDYLNSDSDFSFELEILNTVLASGYQFFHGGTYEDPVTGISREYDIRGIATKNKCEIRFAIECKNLRENFPLVVLRVPRNSNESSHYLWSKRNEPDDELGVDLLKCSPSRYYESNEKVGKSCSQVGRNNSRDKGIIASDSEVYKKWSQAVSSAYGLLADFRYGVTQSNYLMVLPILVVPDERLWLVDYNQQGRRSGDPVQANNCSYFLNKSYSFNPGVTGKIEYTAYTISHLEIMTKTGLRSLLHDLRNDRGMWQAFFHDYMASIFP